MARGGLQVGGNFRGAWDSDTFYSAHDLVLDPSSGLVAARMDHVSGASYDASLWSTTGAVPGIELAYAEITANFVAGAATATDAPGLSITLTEPARPYMLRTSCYGLGGSLANQYVYMQIIEVGGAGAVMALAENYVNTAATARSTFAERRMPAPGTPGTSRTFKVQTLGAGGSIPTIAAVATGPAILQAVAV